MMRLDINKVITLHLFMLAPHINYQKIAVLFPGQGSQHVGMVNELAQAYPQVKQPFEIASDTLGFDLWQICQDKTQLNDTQYTQPALLTASMAIWQLLQTQLSDINQHIAYLAGHSLGEYSALCAADVLAFTDAVRLVYERGKLMTAVMAENKATGAMAAILGLADENVMAICEQAQKTTGEVVSAANFNAVGQVVIAGQQQAVEHAMTLAKQAEGKAISIAVSVPSHCVLMQPAQQKLAAMLADINFQPAHLPVVQNRHARVETSLTNMKTALTEQLSMPVKWTQTMQYLVANQVDLAIECGTGKVLTNLAKRQAQKITTLPTHTLTHVNALIKELL